ncbi:MAG: toprim domain-containing protein [Planctomycetales bacterium]|nr:toprim domain-containing protein [Planctomycetales bacterium]
MTAFDLDRRSELEAFKRLNLSLIASSFGYEIDRRKSTRHSVLMESGNDKIIVAQNGQHYVYCSVYDTASSGTVIDFAQRVIDPGCSLGRVRQLLRPFLNSGYVRKTESRCSGRFAKEIRPSETDLVGVAARMASFVPIAPSHPYLTEQRGVPADLLTSKRLTGRVLCCPRRGSVVFPHWGRPAGGGEADRCLVGYEIKGPGVNLFSKGGRKGLWMSAGRPGDRILAFAESGLDALSYLAVRADADARAASVSGRLNPDQPALMLAAVRRMEEGARVVAAFDNDEAGDRLTEELAAIVVDAGRSDLSFVEDRPRQRGADWNDVLKREPQRNTAGEVASPRLGR